MVINEFNMVMTCSMACSCIYFWANYHATLLHDGLLLVGSTANGRSNFSLDLMTALIDDDL